MKKFLTMLLAAATLFTLAACGTTPNPTGNDTQGDGQNVTPVEAPQITTLYDEDFDYTDGVGNGGHYTYRIPRLKLIRKAQKPSIRLSPTHTGPS